MIDDDINSAARLIAGCGDVSAWLLIALEIAVSYLAAHIEGSRTFPNRAELREQLMAISRLRQWPLAALLEGAAGAEGIDADEWERAIRALHPISLAAERAAEGVRSGRGRDEHRLNPDGLSIPVLCAAIVAIAWEEVRHEPVPHTSHAAHLACAALWQRAGGKMESWGKSLNGWRWHLQTAKKVPYQQLGALRDMIVAAQTRVKLKGVFLDSRTAASE